MTNRATMGGDAFDSNGDPFNWVDSIKLAQRYNLKFETINNGASAFSKRIRAVSGAAPYYFYLNVPAGRRFILFDRSLSLSEGDFNIDVVATDGTVTGGTPSLKATLFDNNPVTIQTELLCGVTVAGNITELENGWADSGTTQGHVRSSGSVGTSGVFKGFESPTLLRIERVDNVNDFIVNLILIGWEEAV